MKYAIKFTTARVQQSGCLPWWRRSTKFTLENFVYSHVSRHRLSILVNLGSLTNKSANI